MFFKNPPPKNLPGHPTGRMCGIGILESRTKTFALCNFSSATTQATWFLQVLPRSRFKRLVLGMTHWQHAYMTTTLKSPKGLKDSKCKKLQLSSQPPLPYVPPTNLVTNKESSENLKIKLPDGTIFNMTIFSQGKTKEYLAHVVTKELNVQCRKLGKTVNKLAGTLENLQKSIRPKGSSSKEDQEACKLELSQTQEMLKVAWKAHNEAVAKMYNLLRNLLSGDLQIHGIGFAKRCTSVTCGLQ